MFLPLLGVRPMRCRGAPVTIVNVTDPPHEHNVFFDTILDDPVPYIML
jgi:hypothetical protein